MKKLIKYFVTISIVMVLSTNVFAFYDFVVDGIYYAINSDGTTVSVTYENYNSYSGSVTIPSTVTINGTTYSVTSIGYQAFYLCTNLISISIPNSVTSISDIAFYGCTGLTSVTIPNSVTSIGDAAFYNCTGLTSITIPNSVTTISGSAFQNCTSLISIDVNSGNMYYSSTDGVLYNKTQTSLICYPAAKEGNNFTIPNSVTSIGGAFLGCTGLTSITIPNSVTYIGGYAFGGCTGLTSITIPNSVTSIGSRAFSGCTGLTSITIPNSVTTIGWSAFQNCTSLISIDVNSGNLHYASIDGVLYNKEQTTLICFPAGKQGNFTIPNIVTIIDDAAFQGCTGLLSITIPNSVTSIDYEVFKNCTGLTSVTIPNSVTSIRSRAFEGCTSLTSITIPNSVSDISGYVFKDCTSLTSITIPNSITDIYYATFQGCTNLTSITIPNSVTSIAQSAFQGCTGLTSITIPNSVTYIGGNAFGGCTGLTSIAIPNTITTINYEVFKNCTSLTSITIPNSVTTIGWSAFQGCMGLTSVTIGNSVTSIGGNAFYGCNNITTLDWNARKCTSYNDAFANKTSITTVSIGDSVEVIPANFLYGCTGLSSINIPNSVTYIGNNAFYGCMSLPIENNMRYADTYLVEMVNKTESTAIIKEGTRFIGNNAFANCDNIINISTNAEYIGDSAFANCDRLVNVNLSDSAKVIDKRAFTNCFRLQNISLGNNLDTIGKNAFDGCIRLNKPLLSDSLLYIGDSAFRRCLLFDSTLIIPQKVNYIGNYAFDSCSLITELRMRNPQPPTIFSETFNTLGTDIPIKVPCGSVIDYYATNYWDNFLNIVEESPFKIEVYSNNVMMGSAEVIQEPTCNNFQAVIQAMSLENYHFVSWSDGNTSNPRIVVIDKDTTFVALFEEDDKYSLQIVSSNNTMGTVEGSGVYYAGETVRIKAIANEHYHFSQWSDGSTDNPRWITVISDNTFVANFAKDTYLVSVESENLAMGTVSGSGEFEYGDNIVISANASEGYKFLQWNDGNTDNPRQIRVENDSTFIANFTVDDGVGLQDKEKDDISISLYPNPTSENSLLSVKGLNEDATVVVTDVQGKVIASSKLMKGHQTMEIESARLASGIYYVRVQNANSVRTEKLIKE